jgi:hypothetical protein
MFYDELDAAQRADWDRKAKEKKDRTKVRFTFLLIEYLPSFY